MRRECGMKVRTDSAVWLGKWCVLYARERAVAGVTLRGGNREGDFYG